MPKKYHKWSPHEHPHTLAWWRWENSEDWKALTRQWPHAASEVQISKFSKFAARNAPFLVVNFKIPWLYDWFLDISRYFIDISLIFHWYPIFLWLYQKSQQAMAGAMCAMCAMPCVPWPSGWSLAPRTARPAGRSDPSNSPANSCVVTCVTCVTCVVTNGRILRWSKRSK